MKHGGVEETPVGEVALGIDILVRCVRDGDRHSIFFVMLERSEASLQTKFIQRF